MNDFRLLCVAVLVTASSQCAAAPQPVECPSEIPQPSIRLFGVPNGWTAYVASPLYLHSAGAAVAQPEKLATLVGETSGKPGVSKEWSSKYSFEGEHPDGKWLQCGYGEYNQVILAKRLDDRTRECLVKYRKGEMAGQNILTVACR